MTQITDHLANIERRIDEALIRSGRSDSTVTVVAVSKRHPAAAVVEAAAAGLTHFGENYLQEGLEKMRAVADSAIEWHFIGRVQSNKTRQIASHFAWVDTMDRRRIADRLNAHRPAELPPLNVLIQLNLDAEPQKSGVSAAELLPLAEHISQLPKLRLRGVMGMPPAGNSVEQNRASFRAIAAEAERLGSEGFEIDTISMGMSSDFELAIECGSTCVRLGTVLFGPRPQDPA
ncbi:MAG TPA: YggS family pyridoxal phosphate-dependent enzyme [Gammaproteobacteria bacterium]